MGFELNEEEKDTVEKIIFAQELEKKKWALEIHDSITQSLVLISYRFQALKRLLVNDPQKVQKDLDELEKLITEAISEARSIMDDLRPSILDDIGLIPAIQKYIRKVIEESRISVNFRGVDLKLRLPSEVETAVYRIIQEALVNVRKHAKATHIKIEIDLVDNQLVVNIDDNGIGFDVEAVDNEGDNWGLIGMRERANIIGGSLEIKSSVGEGTLISLKVPMKG
jgi:two-component system sensor histidine kinase DegS